jgi:hypothetical protein
MKETAAKTHCIAMVLGPETNVRESFDLLVRCLTHRKPIGNYSLQVRREAGPSRIVVAFLDRADADAFANLLSSGSSPTLDAEGWASCRQIDLDKARRGVLEALAPKPARKRIRLPRGLERRDEDDV